MITIVCGPMGCGKTSNADHLMAKLGCDSLYEGWAVGEDNETETELRKRRGNVLVLTFETCEVARRAWPHARVFSFYQAMQK